MHIVTETKESKYMKDSKFTLKVKKSIREKKVFTHVLIQWFNLYLFNLGNKRKWKQLSNVKWTQILP